MHSSPRLFLKFLLRRIGLLNYARAIQQDILGNSYPDQKVHYKGIEFPIYGPIGDFQKSLESYGVYEPLLMDRVLELCDSAKVVIDIGSAEGFFSAFLWKCNANLEKIYALDPDESRSRILRKNIARLGIDNIEHLSISAGDNDSDGQTTIDSLVDKAHLESVDLIKMDVEGLELEVLAGSLNTIRSKNPHVLIEVHPPKIESRSAEGLSQFLKLIDDLNVEISLCPNHRGPHRGPVEGWRRCSLNELREFIDQRRWRKVGNFYIELSPCDRLP